MTTDDKTGKDSEAFGCKAMIVFNVVKAIAILLLFVQAFFDAVVWIGIGLMNLWTWIFGIDFDKSGMDSPRLVGLSLLASLALAFLLIESFEADAFRQWVRDKLKDDDGDGDEEEGGGS